MRLRVLANRPVAHVCVVGDAVEVRIRHKWRRRRRQRRRRRRRRFDWQVRWERRRRRRDVPTSKAMAEAGACLRVGVLVPSWAAEPVVCIDALVGHEALERPFLRTEELFSWATRRVLLDDTAHGSLKACVRLQLAAHALVAVGVRVCTRRRRGCWRWNRRRRQLRRGRQWRGRAYPVERTLPRPVAHASGRPSRRKGAALREDLARALEAAKLGCAGTAKGRP